MGKNMKPPGKLTVEPDARAKPPKKGKKGGKAGGKGKGKRR